MSIVDDLRSLDTNDPGRWPLPSAFELPGYNPNTRF